MSGLGVTVDGGLPSAVPKQRCPRSGGDTVSGRGRQQGRWEETLDSASQTGSSGYLPGPSPYSTPIPLPPPPSPPQTVSKDGTGIPTAQQALFSGIEEAHHFGTAKQARSQVSNEKKAAAAAQPGSVHALSGHCQAGQPCSHHCPPCFSVYTKSFVLQIWFVNTYVCILFAADHPS